MSNVIPLRAFKDNYIWAITSLDPGAIFIVDPGEAEPVIEFLQKNNLSLSAILLTHHHYDHSNGISKLRQHFSHVKVFGKGKEIISDITDIVKDGDIISQNGLTFKVMEIPGHTLDHVAYYGEKRLYCGDTLFSAGCGRIFEGTPFQMYGSLQKIKALPEETQIYCGHEYTVANLRFALLVEPNNAYVQEYLAKMQALLLQGKPTLPSTLKIELKINPFLRCEENGIMMSVQNYFKCKETDPIKIFTYLREWKNQVG